MNLSKFRNAPEILEDLEIILGVREKSTTPRINIDAEQELIKSCSVIRKKSYFKGESGKRYPLNKIIEVDGKSYFIKSESFLQLIKEKIKKECIFNITYFDVNDSIDIKEVVEYTSLDEAKKEFWK